MSKKMQIGALVSTAVMVSALSAGVYAEVSPFATKQVDANFLLADAHADESKGDHEGKCGEGKCGEGMMDKSSPAPAGSGSDEKPHDYSEKGE